MLERGGAVVDAQTKLGATALHVAAEQGKLDVVALLLSHRAVVDRKTDAGLTALHFAAEHDRREISRHLLLAGAAADARTLTGHTAMHVAITKGHTELTQLLLTEGRATVDATTNLGHTSLLSRGGRQQQRRCWRRARQWTPGRSQA